MSPMHTQFAKLCLKAHCYPHSYSIVKTPVTDFTQNCGALDVICYNYYRGMLLTGLQQYPAAIEAFKLVLQSPTKTLHQVFAEAYKKSILLNLILTGKLQKSLKTMNYQLQ